jgi:hypothetical protein
MKKIKLIKKLTCLTLIGGGVLATLPLVITSCGSHQEVFYGNLDASNWKGVTAGTLTYTIEEETGTVTYTGHSADFEAKNLVFPKLLKSDNGKIYDSIKIGADLFENTSAIPFLGLTGTLSFEIGCKVLSIGANAFVGCSNLIGNLVLPNTITSIGGGAFEGCSGFTGDLNIPPLVSTISSSTFYGCNGFNGTLNLGSKITSIADYSFQGCSSLTGSLTIPISVTRIDAYAFADCAKFDGALTIYGTTTSVGNQAFNHCALLSAIWFYGFTSTPS